MTMLYRAIEFAKRKHAGQVRKGTGDPYLIHPLVVSYLLFKFKASKNIEELVVAAILHDTLEDTDTTFEEIAAEFSPLVAALVLELTSDEAAIKALGKNEYFKKKLIGISSYALVLKLVDRLHNVSDHPKRSYVIDTIELVQHIGKKRKLTKTHKAIVAEILATCEMFLAKEPAEAAAA